MEWELSVCLTKVLYASLWWCLEISYHEINPMVAKRLKLKILSSCNIDEAWLAAALRLRKQDPNDSARTWISKTLRFQTPRKRLAAYDSLLGIFILERKALGIGLCLFVSREWERTKIWGFVCVFEGLMLKWSVVLLFCGKQQEDFVVMWCYSHWQRFVLDKCGFVTDSVFLYTSLTGWIIILNWKWKILHLHLSQWNGVMEFFRVIDGQRTISFGAGNHLLIEIHLLAS